MDDTGFDERQKRRSSTSDPFVDALNIVVSAKHARAQAEKAKDRADSTAALAARAKQKAESLKEIASNLANAASSIITTALRLCSLESLEKAYEKYPYFENIISLSDALAILKLRDLNSTSSHRLSDIPFRDNFHPEKPSTEKDYCSPRKKRPDSPDPVSELPIPELTSANATKVYFDSKPPWGSKDHCQTENTSDQVQEEPLARSKLLVSPNGIRQNNNSLPISPRGSFRPIQDENLAIDRNKKDVGKEKLVSSVSPNVHRNSMAATFDITASIAPLWEDRYVDDSGKVHIHSIYSSDKWNERIAMRQFQMNLQKTVQDPDQSENTSQSRGCLKNDDGGSNCDAVSSGASSFEGIEVFYTCSDERGQNDRSSSNDSTTKSPEDAMTMKMEKFTIGTQDDSSDSEVENILEVKSRPLRQVKDLEKHPKGGMFPHSQDTAVARPVSPLLSNLERALYKVSAERDSRSPRSSPLPGAKPRHMYKPESPLASPSNSFTAMKDD